MRICLNSRCLTCFKEKPEETRKDKVSQGGEAAKSVQKSRIQATGLFSTLVKRKGARTKL
jgi:hypothetical protein